MESFNNTNFPYELSNYIKKVNQNERNDDEILLQHQLIVKNFIMQYNPRGLLLFHGTGLGKTRTGATIAEYIRVLDNRQVILLAPKSLHANFKNEMIKMYGEEKHQQVLEFVSGRHLMKRMGQPEEIARMALYLATENWVTGSNFVVDGGLFHLI